MSAPRKLKMPSKRESAEIDRAVATDPDAWVASDEEWDRMRPARDVDPELFDDKPQRRASAAAKPKSR
jgi:hypothetical protein